jgi:hypothetical protein
VVLRIRPPRIVDSVGNTTTYQMDADGRATKVVDPHNYKGQRKEGSFFACNPTPMR